MKTCPLGIISWMMRTPEGSSVTFIVIAELCSLQRCVPHCHCHCHARDAFLRAMILIAESLPCHCHVDRAMFIAIVIAELSSLPLSLQSCVHQSTAPPVGGRPLPPPRWGGRPREDEDIAHIYRPRAPGQPGGAVYRPPLWGATSSARARVHHQYQSL